MRIQILQLIPHRGGLNTLKNFTYIIIYCKTRQNELHNKYFKILNYIISKLTD